MSVTTSNMSPEITRPIPYGRQNITDEDIQAVTEALKSDYLTQGPRIAKFEEAFAQYVGAEYAVAVSNGTAALHLSVMALGLEKGDKVIVPPITFAASANCIRYCGGEVTFSDIDPETYLLDLDKVREVLETAPVGTYKGIVPVDFAGRAVDLEAFRKLADEFGCWLLEDACHAPGGFFRDSNGEKQNCGNGKFADLSIFSFHPVKHIAAGEGGMITTDSKDLYEHLCTLRTHGITRDHGSFTNDAAWASGGNPEAETYPRWYMEMHDLGYNYRLTDLQAALAESQLERADDGLHKRKEIAARYQQAFAGHRFIKGQSGVVEGHAYHLYVVEVEDRLALYNHLISNKIYVQIHYIPCHLMPYYRQYGWKEGDLPHSETYYKHCLSLPMFPTLEVHEQQFVIDTILEFYK